MGGWIKITVQVEAGTSVSPEEGHSLLPEGTSRVRSDRITEELHSDGCKAAWNRSQKGIF